MCASVVFEKLVCLKIILEFFLMLNPLHYGSVFTTEGVKYIIFVSRFVILKIPLLFKLKSHPFVFKIRA